MLLDDEKEQKIKDTFKLVAQYKEDAKASNSSASALMKGLAESMSADKEERKLIKKSLAKAFKEYWEDLNGDPDTLEDALTVVNVVCTKEAY